MKHLLFLCLCLNLQYNNPNPSFLLAHALDDDPNFNTFTNPSASSDDDKVEPIPTTSSTSTPPTPPQKKTKRRKKTSSSSYAKDRKKPGEICDSLQGHRFNNVPPAKKNSLNPLSFCQNYWKNTCCNKTHTDVILHKDRVVAAAKFSATCRHYSEMVQCSSCHPGVGTGKTILDFV